MNQAIMDCFTNPVKCRLFLEIHSAGHSTAKRLSEACPDIAQATLYRYLKRMTQDGVLKVVGQTQTRGAVEKTYALAVDLGEHLQERLKENDGQAYLQLFLQYIIGFLGLFQEYCARPDINLKEDGSGFSTAPIYVTREELGTLGRQIGALLEPFRGNTAEGGRALHSFGLMVSPPHPTGRDSEETS